MTGAPIPDGANCVVRQENTEIDGDVVKIFESLKPYDNFCYKADFKAGTKILEEGEILDSSRVMSLASLGFDKVKVYKSKSWNNNNRGWNTNTRDSFKVRKDLQ